MEFRKSECFYCREIKFTLRLSAHELKEAAPHEMDQRLVRERMNSDSIADQLLAMEYVVRRIEAARLLCQL